MKAGILENILTHQ